MWSLLASRARWNTKTREEWRKQNNYSLCSWVSCMKEQYLKLKSEYVLKMKLMSEWRFMYLVQCYPTLGVGNVKWLLARSLVLLSRYLFYYYSVPLYDHISLHNLDLIYASASILNRPYGELHECPGNQKYAMINHGFCYLLSRWKELWNKRHFMMVSMSLYCPLFGCTRKKKANFNIGKEIASLFTTSKVRNKRKEAWEEKALIYIIGSIQ